MEIQELGARLRARRTAAGETIASVAMRAGLSVPYIANLENGRGNPTLTALSALAQALGADLRVELAEPADEPQPGPPTKPALPASLARFARSPRFATAANHLAEQTGLPAQLQRERLVAAMAAVSAATPGPLSELDCHRILDAITLIAGSD
ncbi:MAG TPA: helix-turn-helix transcriptional regulator [Streptosporangiaceae bacterium]|jgi:transcriptional regulator with XRE-family HTH domain|nr:helix-turn-helix transcriptional regulator [Streptosporangiaceae bacterium]